jgi:hypothetical protein
MPGNENFDREDTIKNTPGSDHMVNGWYGGTILAVQDTTTRT